MIGPRVPEGDTILWAATRMRPVLEGQVPEQITMPAPRPGALRGLPECGRWPARLSGRRVEAIDTLGKNLLVRFEGGLVLRSHLRMTGAWAVYERGRRWGRAPSRAWMVIRHAGREVVQFDGPVLELMSAARARHHDQLARLGPDVLAASFDSERFIQRLRAGDPNRPIADALLDQRTIAGIGNIWKSEGCWEAQIDPWRPVREVSDRQALAIVEAVRPRMLRSGTLGPRYADEQVYRRARRPCMRCGEPIRVLVQGDGARVTYWCPACQR